MSPTSIVIIVIAALVIIGVALIIMRRREQARLKDRFGPEYDHQVKAAGGSEAKAQAELLKREKRVDKFDLRPLTPEQRHEFAADWQQVQARFVDDPERSIALADALLADVMKARGYPVEDFEQRASDISVAHPGLVENYRAAHAIAVRRAQGQADTEDLRAAFLGYRNLFEELLTSEEADVGR